MINLEWVYYENLLKEYPENYLIDLLRTGNLQPYDKNRKQIYCPREYHEYFYYIFVNKDRPPEIVKRITEISDTEPDLHRFDGYNPNQFTKLSWKFLWVPDGSTEREKLFSILRNTQFKKNEFDGIDRLSAERSENQFSTSPETEWCDIRIEFVDSKNIKITPGSGRTLERSYKSFGCFHNEKSKRPSMAWLHLLALAVHKGNPQLLVDSENEITVKHVSTLQKDLKHLFPDIDGDPFKRYVSGRGWEPRIKLSLSKSFSSQYRT